MNEPSEKRARAIALMAEALALLDECGEDIAAGHLQFAHDIAARGGGKRDGSSQDEASETPGLAMDRAAVRALGGTFAVIASALARANIIPMRELADLLAIYATATAETDERQGLLIGCWAGILRDAADHSAKS